MGNQATRNLSALALKKAGIALLITVTWVPQVVAQSAGEVVETRGQVEVKIKPTTTWQSAKVNDVLANGDEIQTLEGKSTLLLSDESMLKLNRNTYMRMREVSQTASWRRNPGIINAASPTLKSIYRLFKGEAWLRNNNREVDIEVVTPTVTASLRGTELHIEVVSPELVNITVLEGAVSASNASGSIEAVAGELIIAPLGQVPTKQTLLTPEDSVQWTVRVPNIIERQDWLYATASASEQQSINALISDLNSQSINSAQQRLTSLQGGDSQRFNSLTGLVNMSAGNHTLARQSFSQASAADPNDPIALRGLALSSLLIGNKTEALTTVQRATSAQQQKSVDWLLRSYIERANFDLPAAEASAKEAISREPSSVLALTNLSLLQFADDRVIEARKTIEQSLSIAPRDSLSLSMLGFIQLSQRDHDGASASFAGAIKSDPSNSEAYLGTSLLAQREGRILEAQQSLATAIALEPQRSLYLSYWAKALHQEERFEKALTVLDSAQRLDKQDPTPHYYRAIIEQDLFRAGESISSIQNAISLNDQRAVYRSRLLLDRDLATRNFNLANIYGALGLNRLATQKAVQSTIDDFRNFSAHLFLSRSLTLEGRNFPADSEVLVSGLLLPANANSLSSINDYTVFFEGPEIDSNVQMQVGSSDNLGVSATLGGVLPEHDISYGILANYAEFEDFDAPNNQENRGILGRFKWQIDNTNTILARVNINKTKRFLGAFEQLENLFIFEGGQAATDSNLLDIGLRRELSNRSDLLINLRYFDNEFEDSGTLLFSDPDFSQILSTADQSNDSRRETFQAQGQYSVQFGRHQLFTGINHQTGTETVDLEFRSRFVDFEDFLPAETFPIFEQARVLRDQERSKAGDRKTDIEFSSLYIDDIWKVNDKLTVQAGLYAEDFDNEVTQEFELNPRLGAVWKPTLNDTIRLAAFRYILPQVQGRLHPTHTAGIFITRNTEEGALVEEFNIVWERNWRNGIFTANVFDLDRENREQRFAELPEILERSSLRGISLGFNQQLGDRFGLASNLTSTELRDDLTLLQIERDEINADITLSFVSPRRFSARIRQSWRRINFLESDRATESIPLTDILLGYTFRNRKGDFSLSVSNLLDREFEVVSDAFSVGARTPARQILGSISWNF